jgi:hypothetical protein
MEMTMQSHPREDSGQELQRRTEADRLVLQAHLAEYKVLKARNTATMQWSWALIPAALVFLGLVCNAWQLMDHRLLVWGAAAGIQVIVLISVYQAYDHCMNIAYIETDLHDAVTKLLRRASPGVLAGSFWDYEAYNARTRGEYALWWEWMPVVFLPVLVTVVTLMTVSFSLWDWRGFAVNLLILALATRKTLGVKRARKTWYGGLQYREKA